MKKLLSRFFIFPMLLIIAFYRYVISPIFPPNCRYNPTCSSYFRDALIEWGLFKGSYLGVKRILRCHPWGSFGDDPVPRK
jgi:putative membrane protein insertion efficiency factor